MFSNSVLVTKNADNQIVIISTLCYKGEDGEESSCRFTGYGIQSVIDQLQVSRHAVVSHYGEPQYDAVIEKLLTLRGMILLCPQPSFGAASVFEARWGTLPLVIEETHRVVVRELMLKDEE